MTTCETSTVAGLADTETVKAGGSCTVMGEARLALAVSGAPLFRSDPVKVAPSESEPALEGVQVQVKVEFTPGVTTCGGVGVAALQIPEGDAVKDATVAEAPPLSLTARRTVKGWPALTVVGLPTTAIEAVSAAGACTVTDAETDGVAVTGCPEFASVPAAAPLSVSAPALVGVQVQLKICEPFAAMLVAPGVTAPQVAAADPETAGVTTTPFACALPPFPTVKSTVMGCPTSAVPGLAETVATSAGGSWTVMGDGRLALAVSAAPVLASEPVTAAVRLSGVATAGRQVQLKTRLVPPGTVCGVAGPSEVQAAAPCVAARAVPVTPAVAPPVLRTVSRTASGCPTLAEVGSPSTPSVAASAAGACTVTVAGEFGLAVSGAEELASTPVALPLNESTPADGAEHDQAKLREPPAGTVMGGAGVTVWQVAVPLNTWLTTALTIAPACPPFVTVKVIVTGWLASTVERLAEMVATRPAGSCDRTSAVTGGLGTFWPENTSFPATDTARSRCPTAVGTTTQVKVVLSPAAREAKDAGSGPVTVPPRRRLSSSPPRWAGLRSPCRCPRC